MKTGVSYMGHHNPRHLKTDIREMQKLQLDDVMVAAQENDFIYSKGKLQFVPEIAADYGLRPLVVFWGALNLFGGGCSSQFLLSHPEGSQVALDGSRLAEGCFMNSACVARIKEMIDIIVERGFKGYFVDEPTPLKKCYCAACRRAYTEWYQGDLAAAPDVQRDEFRRKCVVEYVRTISDYCKARYPALETITCVMPRDSQVWQPVADIASLDNLGTDLYWVNNDKEIETMAPIVRNLDRLCKGAGKRHHEWLQCWNVRKGREPRILEQGKILVREKPDTMYIWAWHGQVGMNETCDDPKRAWKTACEVLRLAKS